MPVSGCVGVEDVAVCSKGQSRAQPAIQNKTDVPTPCGGDAGFPTPSMMEGAKINWKWVPEFDPDFGPCCRIICQIDV